MAFQLTEVDRSTEAALVFNMQAAFLASSFLIGEDTIGRFTKGFGLKICIDAITI